jgi:large subunit ribosomal protein L6e
VHCYCICVPLTPNTFSQIDQKFNDAFFAKTTVKGSRSAEAEFFEGDKPKAKEAFPEAKAADQKEVDKVIISALKKSETHTKYLRASWGLSKGQYPHQLVF